MGPTRSCLALTIVVIILVSSLGCKAPAETKGLTEGATPSTAPLSPTPSTPVVSSTTAVAPSASVTPSAVEPSTPPTPTPTPTPTPKPSVPLAPARFVLGDLTINPTAVVAGEKVTCSIQVSNIGGTEGSYTVVFKYKSSGGATGSDNVEVTLMPGQTRTATLTTTKSESGTYFINVNGKSIQYTVTPRLATKPFARQTGVEVVTNNAAAFNPKGGNQTRIVRTKDGVFTVYIVEHNGDFDHEWQLAKRQLDGTWTVIAQGDAGTFPANLLASPDGTLHVIGWSNGIGTMWSGNPKDGKLVMTSTTIPDVAQGDYPYPAAGIDASGNICVLANGIPKPDPYIKGMTPHELRWACYAPSKSQWVTQSSTVDYGYTYSYVFPRPEGQMLAVSTRDTGRDELGIAQPPGAAPWVFNAFMYWRSNDSSSETFKVLSFVEELPTTQYPNPFLKINEAYLDTKDRMHIVYLRNGATTGGGSQIRHRIVSASGTTLFDEELRKEAGQYCRIFQDSKERFYLLGSSGLLYQMDQEDWSLGDPMKLDFQGHELLQSEVVGMYGLSVPRTGTPLSDVIDVGFPSDGGKSWVYFQLDFSGQ